MLTSAFLFQLSLYATPSYALSSGISQPATNSMNPLVTIITVVYNNVHAIRGTIESVLAQKSSEIEFLVIDGGSTDGTIDIIEEYHGKIDRVISEKDSGIFHAMNKGIRLARGQYVNFMNSGDTFSSPDIIAELIPLLSFATYDVIYGDIYVATQGGNTIKKSAPNPLVVRHRIPFCHQSAFVKTSVLREFEFDEKFRMSADFKFFKQCYLGGKSFYNAGAVICNFDKTGISNTNRAAGLRENMRIIRELEGGASGLINLSRTALVLGWLRLRKAFKSLRR